MRINSIEYSNFRNFKNEGNFGEIAQNPKLKKVDNF